MSRYRLALFAMFGLLASSGWLVAEDGRFALVLGNAAYEGSAALKNPANDAADMASALGRIGWKVTLLIDGDRRQMSRTITSFRDSVTASPGATVLFYYAGHGMQIDGINYLIPVRADFETVDDVKTDGISLEMVTQAIDEAKAAVSLVILDACRNNPFAKTGTRSLGGSRGLTVVQSGGGASGSAIMFSTSPGDVANDGSGRNGVFTAAFLKYIETDSKIEDMFRQVTAEVRKTTIDGQKPWINASLSTDFYLMSDALRSAKAAAAKAASDRQRAEELVGAAEAARKDEAARSQESLRLAEEARKQAVAAVQAAVDAKAKAESTAAQKTEDVLRQAEAAKAAADLAVKKAQDDQARAEQAAAKKVADSAAALEKAKTDLAQLSSLVEKNQVSVFGSVSVVPSSGQGEKIKIRARQLSPGTSQDFALLLGGSSPTTSFAAPSQARVDALEKSRLYSGTAVLLQAGSTNLVPGEWLLSARLEGDSSDTFYQLFRLEAGAKVDVSLPRLDFSFPYQVSLASARRDIIAPLVKTAKDTKSLNDTIGTVAGAGALLLAGWMGIQFTNEWFGEDTKTYMTLTSPKAIVDFRAAGHGTPAGADYQLIVFGALDLSLAVISLFELLSPVPNMDLAPELGKLDAFLSSAQPATK